MQPREQFADNPLKALGYTSENILPEGGFGAVLARAGVGKTSFIVQLALNSMIRGQAVLHISLEDPVKKINLWYREVFNTLTSSLSSKQQKQLWEAILPYRFILTLQVDGFSVQRLDERMKDLAEQDIFNPKIILIDGLPFDASVQTALQELKPLIEAQNMHAWFTVKTHRHEDPGQDDLPVQMADVSQLFDTIIQLQPSGKQIAIQNLKGGTAQPGAASLEIDAATMLIRPRNKPV